MRDLSGAPMPCDMQPPGAPRRGRYDHVFAAIDLGTNNCRLLVARPAAQGFRIIDAYSRIVRLGEGLSHSGELSKAAMDRAIDALGLCAHKMAKRRVTRARHVATQACRAAANGQHFLERVARETGLTVEMIAPEAEARLAVIGCLPLLDPQIPHALIFDIGGGSSEIIWLHRHAGRERFEVMDLTSLPIGVVTLAERYGGAEMRPSDFDAMVEEALALAKPFAERQRSRLPNPKSGRVQVLGTSGTVTTLAGVHMGLTRYDRARVDGSFLDLDVVREVSMRIANTPYEARAEIGCIGRDRADLVVAGCAILVAISHLWPAPRLRVADRGLREGILAGLMEAADREVGRGRHG